MTTLTERIERAARAMAGAPRKLAVVLQVMIIAALLADYFFGLGPDGWQRFGYLILGVVAGYLFGWSDRDAHLKEQGEGT